MGKDEVSNWTEATNQNPNNPKRQELINKAREDLNKKPDDASNIKKDREQGGIGKVA